MRLTALATGDGVPGADFAGLIAEVHARAALVALPDGKCVTLVAPELGHMPRGITFNAPADITLRKFLAVGAEVAARGGMLRVAGGALTIDLRGAQVWRSNLHALHLDVSRPSVAQAYGAARSVLDAADRNDGLRHTMGTIFARLIDATRKRDAAAAERAMCSLIGLGEGRTPAGDDYLVGFFAALWACSDTSPGFAAALGTRLVMLAAHTERLSRLYLEAAAEGEVSERIAIVAASVAAGGDDATIIRAVAAALAVGHSSGAAGMLGLLDGCTACSGMPSHHARADTLPAPAFSDCCSPSATLRQIPASSR